jgi:hypothetical protein
VNTTLGITLVVLGLIGLAWGGVTYTTKEKVLDVGPSMRRATRRTIGRCRPLQAPSGRWWHRPSRSGA